jgi:hypothetical protein
MRQPIQIVVGHLPVKRFRFCCTTDKLRQHVAGLHGCSRTSVVTMEGGRGDAADKLTRQARSKCRPPACSQHRTCPCIRNQHVN